MKKQMYIGFLLLLSFTSCNVGQKQRAFKEQFGNLKIQLSESEIKVNQLKQNLEEQSTKYSQLMTEYNELEAKFQNEYNKEILQHSEFSAGVIDPSGLYELSSEISDFFPSGLRIFSLGEGYRIESIELKLDSNYFGQSRNVAKTFGYISPKSNNFYEFYMDASYIQTTYGSGIISFELSASDLGLQGIAFYDGARADSIDVIYTKISIDPFMKKEESKN